MKELRSEDVRHYPVELNNEHAFSPMSAAPQGQNSSRLEPIRKRARFNRHVDVSDDEADDTVMYRERSVSWSLVGLDEINARAAKSVPTDSTKIFPDASQGTGCTCDSSMKSASAQESNRVTNPQIGATLSACSDTSLAKGSSRPARGILHRSDESEHSNIGGQDHDTNKNYGRGDEESTPSHETDGNEDKQEVGQEGELQDTQVDKQEDRQVDNRGEEKGEEQEDKEHALDVLVEEEESEKQIGTVGTTGTEPQTRPRLGLSELVKLTPREVRAMCDAYVAREEAAGGPSGSRCLCGRRTRRFAWI